MHGQATQQVKTLHIIISLALSIDSPGHFLLRYRLQDSAGEKRFGRSFRKQEKGNRNECAFDLSTPENKRYYGILFLSPNLDKASYPQEISQYLKDRHYILDVDANLARKDKMQFIIELIRIMKTRFQVCFELIENEEWDFTQLHIMETDRLFHFLWDELNDVSKTNILHL